MVNITKAISSEAAKKIANKLDDKANRARSWGIMYMAASIGLGGSIIALFLNFSLQIERANSASSVQYLGDIIATSVGTGVLRIGMVLIAIFIIQILVGFARYYFRLAEHISFSADIIRLSDGNTKLIKELSSVLLPSFDFGKIPTSPIQKIVDTSMDTVRELAKKIPTK